MSISHKAFAFDWNGFDATLRPVLEDALRAEETVGLVQWIEVHRGGLTDPYEGEALGEDWRSSLQAGDVQEFGDFALTKFYRVHDDFGLGSAWLHVTDVINESAGLALLGRSVGPPESPFNPGRLGSYFQRPDDVPRSWRALGEVELPSVATMVALLQRCSSVGLGVYITF